MHHQFDGNHCLVFRKGSGGEEANSGEENNADESERKARRRPSSPSVGRSVSADGRKTWADKCPPHYSMPTVSSLSRSRSASPTPRRRLADITLDSTIDPRPPFVVRKVLSHSSLLFFVTFCVYSFNISNEFQYEMDFFFYQDIIFGKSEFYY